MSYISALTYYLLGLFRIRSFHSVAAGIGLLHGQKLNLTQRVTRFGLFVEFFVPSSRCDLE